MLFFIWGGCVLCTQWVVSSTPIISTCAAICCWALQVELVVLVSAFVMVSTVWPVSCLLCSYSRFSPCPAICKSGGHVPLLALHALWSRCHCSAMLLWVLNRSGSVAWFSVEVTVWISSATRDLLLIQQNKFYWISNRSRVAELIYTVTSVENDYWRQATVGGRPPQISSLLL